MIWIFLLYVLPLILGLLLVYYKGKIYGESVGDFLELLPYLFIPLFNISIPITAIVLIIEYFLDNNESWQNFKNKKL